jgi:hypothetical protein
LLAALACCSLLPGLLSGQSVHGRVLDANSRRAIVGALVELRDLTGKPLRIVLTSGSGNFEITTPAAGRYFYRIAAIGYAPRPPAPITVPADGLNLGDLTLSATVMRLPDLLAIGHGKFCGKSKVPDETFDRILESANTSLEIIAATIDSRRVGFDVLEIHERSLYSAMGAIVIADSMTLPLARWPVQSIDPDSLRAFGFGREVRPGDPGSREYYGPDPRVLFADWFLASHCFSLDKVKAGAETLHVRFAPAAKSKLIDIGGELLLDAHNLALLQFSFTHRNLPSWMPDQASGGDMEFQQLASGLWIAASWSIWAPVERLPGPNNPAEVAGRTETRGHVIKVYLGGVDSTGVKTDSAH